MSNNPGDVTIIKSLSDLKQVVRPVRSHDDPVVNQARPRSPGMTDAVGQNRVPGREGRILQVRALGGEWKDGAPEGRGIELRYVAPRVARRARILPGA